MDHGEGDAPKDGNGCVGTFIASSISGSVAMAPVSFVGNTKAYERTTASQFIGARMEGAIAVEDCYHELVSIDDFSGQVKAAL